MRGAPGLGRPQVGHEPQLGGSPAMGGPRGDQSTALTMHRLSNRRPPCARAQESEEPRSAHCASLSSNRLRVPASNTPCHPRTEPADAGSERSGGGGATPPSSRPPPPPPHTPHPRP